MTALRAGGNTSARAPLINEESDIPDSFCHLRDVSRGQQPYAEELGGC